MAKEIYTEIEINASPGKIWNILTDFKRFPEWNPFIKSLTGEVKVGSKINVFLEPPGVKGMMISPVVTSFESNRGFSWQGHLFVTGLFDGKHQFELIDNGNGTTKFIHKEDFGGILIPLFRKMLEVNTFEAFKMMNQKLKELSESE